MGVRGSLWLWAIALPMIGGPVVATAVARPGKVVRVERPRLTAVARVRVCVQIDPSTGRAVCYGSAPKAGTAFVMVDEDGVRGRVSSGAVEPSEQDLCGMGAAHDVEMVGQLSAPNRGNRFSFTLAVAGVEMSDAATLVRDRALQSPSGRSNEQVWVGVDRRGLGQADFLVSAYECDKDAPAVAGRLGSAPAAYCIDYWERDRVDWTRVGQDVFYTCL